MPVAPGCAFTNHSLVIHTTRAVGILTPFHTFSPAEAQRLLSCLQGSLKPQPTSARSWSWIKHSDNPDWGRKR